jgi:4-amino-4-deoxy-L-arabinose transferase-like glycosyltransferase
MSGKKMWVFLVITVLVIIFRFPSLDITLDGDSGANAFLARQMMRGETLYDKFHPTHQLPAIYHTFIAAFTLFGDNQVAPKLLLLPFVIISAGLVYLMGRSFFDDLTAVLATLFFLLGTSQSYLDGMTSQMEHFANLPLIATMFLALYLLQKEAPARYFFWVGILGAICILYKVIFVGSLMAAGFSLLLAFWYKRQQADSAGQLFLRLTWLTAGLILPLAFVALYYFNLGLWSRLMLAFTLGFGYFGDASTFGNLVFFRPFGFPLFILVWNNAPLLFFGLFGLFGILQKAFSKTTGNIPHITVALWMIVSFALTGLRGGGYPHYILTTIPPLALVAAHAISTLYERWKTTLLKSRAVLSASLMVGLICIVFLGTNIVLYRPYISYKLGQITYREFSDAISSFSVKDAMPLATYIKDHTTQDDHIYVWSNSMQIYYFADRTPPIDILWPTYASATGSPQRIFSEDTKYILARDAGVFERPQWFIDGLAKNYILETTMDEYEIYRRLER